MKRYSRKREAILDCLRSTKSHPDAEWIYQRLKPELPELSLATVYRNLSAFISDGEAAEVGTVGGRARYDGDTRPHSHFICERCGEVRDLELIEDEALIKRAEAASGGLILRHSATFRGICGACLEKENTQAKAV